jgi:hypothetical protein
MSKLEKLIKRLISRPKDFSYNELIVLLGAYGYRESKGGRTSGSRVAFINPESRHIIRLHKPHANHELKQYQIDQIIDEFQSRGIL